MIRQACLAVLCSMVAMSARADDPQQPPEKANEKPPAANSSKPDAAKPDSSRPASAIDADLLKSLEKQSTLQEEEENPLLRVGQRMRDVQGRLVKADAGEETRNLQKGIVQDLDKLIEEMKKGGS